jgi:hypothetical protein
VHVKSQEDDLQTRQVRVQLPALYWSLLLLTLVCYALLTQGVKMPLIRTGWA